MTLPISRSFFGLSLFWLSLPIILIGCGLKPIPVFTGKIYSLDVENQAIVRAQEGEVLPIESLDDSSGYIVMTGRDFELFVNTYVTNCKEWHSDAPVRLVDEIERHDPR